MTLRLLGTPAERTPTSRNRSAHQSGASPRNLSTFGLLSLLVAGWAGTAAAQPASLTRYPFLQLVTQESAVVVWKTATAAACTLTYQRDGGSLHTITTDAGTQHVATLTDLSSDTVYDYAIYSGGLLAGGPDYTLRTAPPAGSRPIRFLAWGDGGDPTANQSAIAAMVAQQTVDLTLFLGDIVMPDGRASYQDPRHFSVYNPLMRHTPSWATPGNHDYYNLQTYLDVWYLPTNPVTNDERYFSFDYGDIHFLSIDTNVAFPADVLQWMADDLAATDKRWKVVFYHQTIYSCGSVHGSDTYLINTLGPIFDAHGVDLAMGGHDHHFERSWPMYARQAVNKGMNPNYTDPGGTVYVIAGGTASPRTVYTSCSHTARAFKTPCVARVEVAGDSLVLDAVGTAGEVLDRMTIHKSDGPPPPPPQSLELWNPVGGEALTVGEPLDIHWSSSDGVGPVNIEIARDGGPWETLFASTANDGVEMWTITGPAASRCWMRISEAADGIPSALSQDAFAIVTTPPGGDPVMEPKNVSFRPAGSPVPVGFIADMGHFFDAVQGYGWITPVSVHERGVYPGSPRDTFAEVPNDDAPAVWELALPDGYYRVALMCGDPQESAVHRVALEGQVVIDNVPSDAGNYVDRIDLPVLVQDGRLTLTVGGGPAGSSTKVNAVAIIAGQPTEHVLLAPAGGERYCTGTSIELLWSGATAGSMVRIDISRNGTTGPWTPTWVTADDGVVSWTVVGPAAEECCLRLVSLAGDVLAQSPATFTIIEPGIRVVSPNGGETWGVGTQRAFQWTNDCLAGEVRIEVSRNGPDGPYATVIPATPNDGIESWTVRSEDVGWTHVRIVSLPLETPADRSDAPFAVATNPPAQTEGWHIDFHPAGGLTAAGYEPDVGLPYSEERGYGWDVYVRMKERGMLPGDCRDNFVQVANDETATWRLPVPIGAYRITLVCGDPFTSGTHRVEIEGQRIVNDVYATGGHFVTREVLVDVMDGDVTMTLGGSGDITSTKVGCLDIEPLGGPNEGGRRGRNEYLEGEASVPQADRLVIDGAPWRGPVGFTLELARAGIVRMAVHDVRGRRLATLQEGELPAGRHAFSWQARHPQSGLRLASGVYFLRLETADRQETHKLLLIR